MSDPASPIYEGTSFVPREPSRGQRALLAVALPVSVVSVLCGLALLFISGNAAHVIGYVLCSPVPFVLVALQRRAAIEVEAATGKARPGREVWLVRAILVVGFLGAVAHAWSFAWDIS